MNFRVFAFITVLISLSVPHNSPAQVVVPLSKVIMTIGAISEEKGSFMSLTIKDFFASTVSISAWCRCAMAPSA